MAIDGKAILEWVKANQAKLKACKLHEFRRKGASGRDLFKHVCAHCGGEVDGIAVAFYQQGLEHGKAQ